jgi:hypothetical protein
VARRKAPSPINSLILIALKKPGILAIISIVNTATPIIDENKSMISLPIGPILSYTMVIRICLFVISTYGNNKNAIITIEKLTSSGVPLSGLPKKARPNTSIVIRVIKTTSQAEQAA